MPTQIIALVCATVSKINISVLLYAYQRFIFRSTGAYCNIRKMVIAKNETTLASNLGQFIKHSIKLSMNIVLNPIKALHSIHIK